MPDTGAGSFPAPVFLRSQRFQFFAIVLFPLDSGAGVNMKSDTIKVKGGRREKNTVLILAMMIMLVGR
jgi:hypothetical protein